MFQSVTQTTLLVAITVLLSTVVPVAVSAEDTVLISNDVPASSHTGGADGDSGEDGQAGQDGKDGRDGQDGESGTASAGASVTNMVSGSDSESVVHTNTSGHATATIEHTIERTSSTSRESSSVTTTTQSVSSSDSIYQLERSQLLSLIASLRAALTAYVQSFF